MGNKALKWKMGAILVGLIALGAMVVVNRAFKSRMLVSCNNHERFLWVALLEYGTKHEGNLPYEYGVPGWVMLNRFSTGIDSYRVSCNHSAPRQRTGGWQCVNLPPAAWREVASRWKQSNGRKRIPFAWCGKPTGQGVRVTTTITSFNGEEGFNLIHDHFTEKELVEAVNQLNDIVKTLGQPPVELNVPDGLDWLKMGQVKAEPKHLKATV